MLVGFLFTLTFYYALQVQKRNTIATRERADSVEEDVASLISQVTCFKPIRSILSTGVNELLTIATCFILNVVTSCGQIPSISFKNSIQSYFRLSLSLLSRVFSPSTLVGRRRTRTFPRSSASFSSGRVTCWVKLSMLSLPTTVMPGDL